MSSATTPEARALKASVPVFFGYAPMGIAFGLLFGKLGLPWWHAALSGIVVFAGAAQFLSVGLFAANASLASIFLATLFLNLRHVFYGLSFLRRYPDDWRKTYLIFGLTDETYSVLTATKTADKEADERFCMNLTALNHAYWASGCALGGLLGSRLAALNTKGLDFVLPALFAVLTVEQALATRRAFPFLLAAAAGAAALIVKPDQMLLVSLSLVFAALFLRSGRPA